ncbi:MAG: hypothetical protein WC662_04770 [Candidatus Paceibacterota bacterium]|jgi:hypothetical protein
MKKFLLIGCIILAALALWYGLKENKKNLSNENSNTTFQNNNNYSNNSWKTLIPDTCLKFNDGCNTCVRSNLNEKGACTKINCAVYQKPYCLDSE